MNNVHIIFNSNHPVVYFMYKQSRISVYILIFFNTAVLLLMVHTLFPLVAFVNSIFQLGNFRLCSTEFETCSSPGVIIDYARKNIHLLRKIRDNVYGIW